MEIQIKNTREETVFSNVDIGDVFIFAGTPYLKLTQNGWFVNLDKTSSAFAKNCLNLESNTMEYFRLETPVLLADSAKVIIEINQ